jgi:uracil-DNA glycosylase
MSCLIAYRYWRNVNKDKMDDSFAKLLAMIAQCRVCANHLPFLPSPTLQAHSEARILLVGQAPGTIAHRTQTPWNDRSGERLRHWLSIDREMFYHSKLLALVPMGFCYPGKDKNGGDKPPRPECAPLWHGPIQEQMPHLSLTLLIGGYAQRYYLKERMKPTMTATVQAWKEYAPEFMPLPHPSWRNTHWLRRNPWFEHTLIPDLQIKIREIL